MVYGREMHIGGCRQTAKRKKERKLFVKGGE
jgi:hypothetical protein